MCGVTGLILANPEGTAAPEICDFLGLLQHRGQDACGIVTCGPKGRFYQCKANGMVRDVLDQRNVGSLIGRMGVGHVRYPTAGSFDRAEAQPLYVSSPCGLVLGHNGNLINTPHLRYYLDHYAHRHINTDSDSELLLNVLADNLQKTGKFRLDEDDIFRAISGLMKHCLGAYACVLMVAGFGIIGFRDPNGVRPLGFARRKDPSIGSPRPGELPLSEHQRYDYMISSESVVCDANGFSDWRDIRPGEGVIITRQGLYHRQCAAARTIAPDIFEYVYFARPDSVIDGISVYRSRMAMGDALASHARDVLRQKGVEVDVVIPVPDTSRVAALQVAQGLGVPYREGFVKNRYVGRTFIMPGQQMRRKNVRRKLNAMSMEFADKNVMLVDDSIVRGTTSKEIIQMARDAGARRVIMASCAPPVRFPNVYGIDMPSRRELVAFGRTEEEVAVAIGADLVIYQKLEHMIESCRNLNPAIQTFDCSVFTGSYITGGVDNEYLDHLEQLRNDNAKLKIGMTTVAPSPTSGLGAPAFINGNVAASSGGINSGPQAASDSLMGCQGPMNGADAAIGLSNGHALDPLPRDSGVGLHNSFSGSFSTDGGFHSAPAPTDPAGERTARQSASQSRDDSPTQEETIERMIHRKLKMNGGSHDDGTVRGMVEEDGVYGDYIPATPVR